MTRIFEKFRNDIRGILWLAVAIFFAMALSSYTPLDPSFNSGSVGSVHHVKNLCGYFGSFLSDILLQLLGVTAWVLVGACLRSSYFAFRGLAHKNNRAVRITSAVLLVINISSLLTLYLPNVRIFSGRMTLGGFLGLVVTHGLIRAFNNAGVSVILWTSTAVLIIFYTEKSLTELMPGRFSLAPLLALFKKSSAQKVQVTERPPLLTQESTPKANISAKTQIPPFEERYPIAKNIGKLLDRKKDPSKALRLVENWQIPSLDLLLDPPVGGKKIDEREVNRNARLVEQKLGEFEVTGQVVEVIPGPAVTMYEFRPAASIKINDITKLADDLSLALSAESLRIIAPIPGRDVVGIETSNSKRDPIFMKELLECPDFWSEDIKLPVALGKNVSGEPRIIDLRKIPHLLVAGTTGSGKSVFTMSLVTSLIMRHSPKTLRLILIDPKQVDLAAFHKIPHLLLPPVKEAKPAVNTLKWLIREMEKRYRSMSKFSAKNIEGYNAAIAELEKSQVADHEEKIKFIEQDPQTAMQSYYVKNLPYIVAVIEEFADLMSVDRAGVEPAVVRLAQMARASGIHLVIAMQSPRREVLTGLIKTNFPGRISFKVASKVDSSIVLDQRGAERLLSVGDMLYLAPGFSQPQRFHGAFLKDEEMTAVTDFWVAQGEPEFETSALSSAEMTSDEMDAADRSSPENEEGYDEVVSFVASQREVSASLIQRRFRFGYPKAARIIELMESQGVVGPANGSKPRQVLANKLE